MKDTFNTFESTLMESLQRLDEAASPEQIVSKYRTLYRETELAATAFAKELAKGLGWPTGMGYGLWDDEEDTYLFSGIAMGSGRNELRFAVTEEGDAYVKGWVDGNKVRINMKRRKWNVQEILRELGY